MRRTARPLACAHVLSLVSFLQRLCGQVAAARRASVGPLKMELSPCSLMQYALCGEGARATYIYMQALLTLHLFAHTHSCS